VRPDRGRPAAVSNRAVAARSVLSSGR
jgi:hypothetical protein